MMKKNKNSKDITNQRFGKLTALFPSEKRSKSGGILWQCICDCGKTTFSLTYHLFSGASSSCGCNRRSKNPELSFKKDMFQDYKDAARVRKYSFNLTFEEFLNLIQQNCYYCDKLPSLRKMNRGCFHQALVNGIDRVDNTIGYTKENCVPCCEMCNKMKMKYSVIEFGNQIQKIYKKLFIDIEEKHEEKD